MTDTTYRSANPPITDWTEQRVWIVGASSGIGAAVAEILLERGARVALSARRSSALVDIAATTPERSLPVPLDVNRLADWQPAMDRILQSWGRLDLILLLAAEYQPMRANTLDAQAAESIIRTNLIGVTNGLSVIVPQLLRQESGTIALMGSVAGYGGLPHALVYGPTKAALINMAESLYLDLHPHGIGVSIINPGFVRTQLTERNKFPMPAMLEPDAAAQRIVSGLGRGAFEIAFPRRLAWPLTCLRLLPRRCYLPLVQWATRS